MSETTTAIEFLKRIQPHGPWALWSHSHQNDDKGNCPKRHFFPGDETDAQKWIDEQQAQQRSVYYRAAAIRADVWPRSATDPDVIGTRLAWVDIDPDKGSDRDTERANILRTLTTDLPAGVKPPTIIVDSGNGFQALWVFRDPWKFESDRARDDFRQINRWLKMRFGADSKFAPSSLLRLPHTINFKRKVGDAFPTACVVSDSGPCEYGRNDFEQTPDDHQPSAIVDAPHAPPRTFNSVNDIPVSAPMRCVIETLSDPLDATKYPAGSYSEAQRACSLALAAALLDGKMSRAEVESVHLDTRFALHKAILYTEGGSKKRANPEKYLQKQIDKALAKVKADTLTERNTGDGWITDKNGIVVYNNPDNIRLALTKMGIVLRYDEFADKMIATIDGETKRLEDKHYVTWRFSVYDKFGFLPPGEMFNELVNDTAYRNTFHPVRDYFNALKWDGRARIERWLIEYGGAEDTPLNCAIGRIVLIAAVRRIRHPGCKFDEMLTLESAQGNFKSTALKILAVKDEWFSDHLPFNGKATEKIEALKGRLIVEAGEIAGLSKAEVESVKAFLSRQSDSGTRLAYGRCERDFPRQCVFIGTTNSTSYLTDTTGNRRFWPVKVGRFNADALARDRDQLWAEAAQAEASGESNRLDPALYSKAAEQQEQRREISPIEEKLAPLFGPGKADGRVSSDKIWEILEVYTLEAKQRLGREVGKIMRSFGWERQQYRYDGGRVWYYVRGDGQHDLFAA